MTGFRPIVHHHDVNAVRNVPEAEDRVADQSRLVTCARSNVTSSSRVRLSDWITLPSIWFLSPSGLNWASNCNPPASSSRGPNSRY